MATIMVIEHLEKGSIVVEIVQYKELDEMGRFNTVAYRYECRASRAGQSVPLAELTTDKVPRNYRNARAFGRKVFGIMKKLEKDLQCQQALDEVQATLDTLEVL